MTRILTIIALLFTTPAVSHGGRTNAEGCHNAYAYSSIILTSVIYLFEDPSTKPKAHRRNYGHYRD